jgi:hypothetical protein
MEKDLLDEILSIVKKQKEKHKVDDQDHEPLSEVIYGLKYGDLSEEQLLKSKEKEADLENDQDVNVEEVLSDLLPKEQIDKIVKKSGLSDADILRGIQTDHVTSLLDTISNLSESDISSPELEHCLNQLLMFKEVKVLHKVLQENKKFREVMSHKLNASALELINNSNAGKSMGR